MNFRPSAFALGSVALLGWFALGCGPRPEAGPQEPGREPPAAARVERRNLVEYCSEDGVLKAVRTLSLLPEIRGAELTAMYVKEGDRVKKGDPLYEFNAKLIEEDVRIQEGNLEALRMKQALLKEHRNGLDKLEADKRRLEADQLLADDRRSLALQEQLADAGLAATVERDRLRAKVKVGELDAEAAKLRREEMDRYAQSPEMIELESSRLALESQINQHRENLKKSKCTAPFAGIILQVSDVIRDINMPLNEVAIRPIPADGPLLTIADIDTMRVQGKFFERDIVRIRPGQQALVAAKHVPDHVFTGTVASVGKLGTAYGQTATVAVEVNVDNQQHLLRPGLTAEIRIVIGEKRGVLAVPVEFIRRSEHGSFVWLKGANGRPRMAPVETGISDGRCVEIVRGAKEGDFIVME
jgi:multidrug efflux pump subunit AcrA (membrane-fusion protein)